MAWVCLNQMEGIEIRRIETKGVSSPYLWVSTMVLPSSKGENKVQWERVPTCSLQRVTWMKISLTNLDGGIILPEFVAAAASADAFMN